MTDMLRRIDLGRGLLVAGAVLLLVALFLPWYDIGPGSDPNAWEVFETLDMVLALLAVAAAAVALRPALAPPGAALALPVAALIIVFVQLVNHPPVVGGADPSTGGWLALAAALAMTAGAALTLTRISVTVSVGERELRRRMPAVDRRQEAGPAEPTTVVEPSAAHEDPDAT
jgi:hypothetical protein